jgi:hypothetical protein
MTTDIQRFVNIYPAGSTVYITTSSVRPAYVYNSLQSDTILTELSQLFL